MHCYQRVCNKEIIRSVQINYNYKCMVKYQQVPYLWCFLLSSMPAWLFYTYLNGLKVLVVKNLNNIQLYQKMVRFGLVGGNNVAIFPFSQKLLVSLMYFTFSGLFLQNNVNVNNMQKFSSGYLLECKINFLSIIVL